MRSLVLVVVALGLPLGVACKKKEPTPLASLATPPPPTAPAAPSYRPRYAQRMFEVALRFHLAGKAVDRNNWDYAAHQATEILETFKSDLPNVLPATGVPAGVDLKALRAQFTNTSAVALVDAAKKRDRAVWDRTYATAAQGCNACHAQVGKGYISIRPKAGNTFEDLIGFDGAR